ncbi:hypothetical protein HDF22_000219 [Mucilaginibacter lappiensis]|uniref:Uncharacterized protein n=1 Tax=Mucilaginibacter lappiensis TaxID=354630 RepID=A0A841JBZ9_9SPHI|nr:hypothetical protein [Mucilaginibacter lappiensis]MBB6126118.1 hypothetical protein [Mucilaginibacter lappiensis]
MASKKLNKRFLLMASLSGYWLPEDVVQVNQILHVSDIG